MKYLLSTLPLAALLVGCGSNGADANTANASIDNAAPSSAATATVQDTSGSNEKAGSAATDSGKASSTATGAGKKSTGTKPGGASANEPDDQYHVVDEAAPGMPPDVTAALDKVKVPPPPKNMKTPDKATLQLVTNKGTITVELDGKSAPLHVKSFIYLSKRGFYNGTLWHRYVPGFVIQGGDPLTKFPELGKKYPNEEFPNKVYGMGGPGYQVPREYNELKHEQYVLAMARSSDPDSAGSQFYFTLEPTPDLDQNEGYTVFGKVLKGQQTVAALREGDKLTSVKVLSETP